VTAGCDGLGAAIWDDQTIGCGDWGRPAMNPATSTPIGTGVDRSWP